ncbi:MAG: enoyl-CoA hydratase/isomerase family protein [Bacteroidetes bacterium]|nr:enoyl-CoA hydratase/isomerase family protein [Bacteroidota bacterium]
MKFETILYGVDSRIATVTINRPDKLNALNQQVFRDLKAVLDDIRGHDDIHGVIITGAGSKAFVAGADITEIHQLTASAGKAFADSGQAVFNQIENLGKPVVAAVNGFALGGGCELAMACTLRIASETARFGQPEVNLGVIPGYGGTQRLTRLIGKGRAMELILTGDLIDAQEAHRIGLINHIYPASELMKEARLLLGKICSKSLVAVRYAIDAVNSDDLPLRDGLQKEASLFGLVVSTADAKEGTRAFLDKRPAVFSHQ